jgi:hypothetical protein
MGIFDKVKKTTIESRRYEEKLYEAALKEVEAGEVRKGLYAKAVAKASGDKEKADGIYLKLRVQSIMDDIESEQINRKENAKVLSEIQALENKKTIEEEKRSAKEESNRRMECSSELESKGYKIIYQSNSGKYDVIDKSIRSTQFCKDLDALCKFADTAPQSQTQKNRKKVLKIIVWIIVVASAFLWF